MKSACGETNKLIVLGNTVPSGHTAGRVFDINGISPTVMERHSKVVQIAVGAAMRGRYNSDGKIEQKIETRDDELSNAITTVQKDNLIIENFHV